jgi:hypothetical protein
MSKMGFIQISRLHNAGLLVYFSLSVYFEHSGFDLEEAVIHAFSDIVLSP